MEKILEKLDNYNIFINIIPGYLMLLFNIYYFNLGGLGVGEQIVLAYFIGQTLNRLGSVLIGKILLKFTKEEGLPYNMYISACEDDKKISLLLQERNMCRTFCALFIICIVELGISKILKYINISNNVIIFIVLLICLAIYSNSFCKYNKYIVDRIRISNQKEKK